MSDGKTRRGDVVAMACVLGGFMLVITITVIVTLDIAHHRCAVLLDSVQTAMTPRPRVVGASPWAPDGECMNLEGKRWPGRHGPGQQITCYIEDAPR